jgi:hypothetical protein
MTMRGGPAWSRSGNRLASLLRLVLAGLLGVAAALLVSCGSSGAGLIPAQNAGPLQGDFEAVAQAAENGDGSCAATEAAVLKTEQDFEVLPTTIDAGLRNRLHEGISHLHEDALKLCKQPLPQTTVPSTSPRTTTSTQTTSTTPTVTQTTSTQTTPTTTIPTTSSPGGGTPAPGAGAGEVAPGAGGGQGGGTGAGEGAAGAGGNGSNGAGVGAPGQESGK